LGAVSVGRSMTKDRRSGHPQIGISLRATGQFHYIKGMKDSDKVSVPDVFFCYAALPHHSVGDRIEQVSLIVRGLSDWAPLFPAPTTDPKIHVTVPGT
jgi:hypothetical protein